MKKQIMQMFDAIKKISHIMQINKWAIIGILVISAISASLSMISPWLEKILIDDVIHVKNISLWLFISLAYFSVLLIRTFWMRISGVLNLKYEQYLDKKGQAIIFKKILYLDKKQIDAESVGNIMQKMSSDFRRYINFLQSMAIDFVINIFTYIFVVALLFANGWFVGVFGIILSPIFAVSFFINSKKLVQYGKELTERGGHINSFIQEKVNGQDLIKINHAEEREINRLEALYTDRNKIGILEFKYRIIPAMLSFAISGLIMALIYVLGSYLIMKDMLTIGEMVSTASWIVMIGAPVNNIALSYLNFNATVGAIDRSNTILDAKTDEERYKKAYDDRSKDLHGDISVQNITFSYDETKGNVLRNLNLRFPSGQRCSVIGESGSGKSTLAKLLTSVYDDYSGDIFIGDRNILNIPLDMLRKNMAIIPQTVTIWNDSISFNLLYGIDNAGDISENEMWEALRLSGLYEKVRSLPDGLQTICGEEGKLFSGGERQRFVIANLLLKNPKIIIFDEATSSLDARLENDILNNIFSLFTTQTIVIITHRLASAKNSDRIFVLQNGQLIAEGTHNSLLENEEYYSLYKNMLNEETNGGNIYEQP